MKFIMKLSELTTAFMMLFPMIVKGGVVLSKNVMDLTVESALLSIEAYKEHPIATGFMNLDNFDDLEDQAIVAEKDGYCFVAFRGTEGTLADWAQNFKLGTQSVCDDMSNTCCDVRKGFYDAYYYPNYVAKLEKKMLDCYNSCKNKDECIVFTGHSQGGAIASVAGIRHSGLNPYVITFGEPPSVMPDCHAISSERWYRYVNTKEVTKLSYDPVPFAPGFGTMVYGHFIILGADNKQVSYIGLDSTKSFSPMDVAGAKAHSMRGDSQYPGYLDRIETLLKNATFPVASEGFAAPNYCTDNDECELKICKRETDKSASRCVADECLQDHHCITGRCDSGLCIPKHGSCMECDEDSDCASGKCHKKRCANFEGKMDDECVCSVNADCASGRCEGTFSPICEARRPNGASCNEHTDCTSDHCGFTYVCSDGLFKNHLFDDLLELAILIIVAIVFYNIFKWVDNYCKKRRGYREVDTVDMTV